MVILRSHGTALLSGPPPRTPPRRTAMAIMCSHESVIMSNVSAPVFLEELERSGGSAVWSKCPLGSAPARPPASNEEAEPKRRATASGARASSLPSRPFTAFDHPGSAPMALLQAWWRRTFPVDGHLSVDDLVRGKLEREAPSEVDAEVFLEELGKPAFETALEEVDGSVAAALLRTWWRGRVPDPDGWWTQSVLDSGDAFWWRESETAEGGMEVRLNDPRNASSEEAEGGGAGGGSAWTSGMLESGAPARSRWPLGSARARLVRLLGARLAALASSALPG